MTNTNMLKIGVLGLVLVAIVGAVYFFSRQPQEPNTTLQPPANQEPAERRDTDNNEEVGYQGAALAGKAAPLLDFAKADYDMVLGSDKLIVLYFYANWCPICKAETESALYPIFNQLSSDQVVGFRVNYNDNQTDNDEKDLAREFGVAYQHTKVFVKNGERILKSPEAWDKNRYENEINRALTQPWHQ